MATLSFTLLPDALLQFHSLLACLVKFNEAVSIEADNDSVRSPSLHLILQFELE